MPEVRMTAYVSGRVQGVGFRQWARGQALELGLRGEAANLDDGRVEVIAEGPESACRRLLDQLREDPAPAGRPGQVSGLRAEWDRPGRSAEGSPES